MDQRRPDLSGLRPPVTLRTRDLVRPARFEAQQLADTRPSRVPDEHAQQLAAAMQLAREEGLRLARVEVDAAVSAHEAARRELAQATLTLAVAVDELRARDRDDLAELERQVMVFAVELAAALLGRELQLGDGELVASMQRSMSLVPDRGAVILRVSPADAPSARHSVGARAELGERVEIVADAAVVPGGCVAEVGPLRIDGQIGQALDRVRAVVAS